MKFHVRWTVAIAGFWLAASPAVATAQSWSPASVEVLRDAVKTAPAEALPVLDTTSLDKAIASADAGAVDRTAMDLAQKYARMLLLGCATADERAGWKIADSDRHMDILPGLVTALAEGRLAAFFESLRPRHPDYAALKAAYTAETDATRRAQLARNLERWRWLPHDPGADFVMVNTASFEASLWRGGARIGTWPVVVGKPKSPTPVFAATITGVTFNPWWDIPGNIVRESIGALVRRNPSLARKRGYVWGGGRYRQRPGPNNALGQMKLVMPNPYSVYLHDTPSKDLFTREVRAFSHGCVRVGDALGFAAALLDGAVTAEQQSAIVTSGETTTVPLAKPLPVYVAYFTATVRADGQLAFMPDIYQRDGRLGDATNPVRRCAA